jgi:outer membrane protein TolC
MRDQALRESADLEVLYNRIRQAESSIQALRGEGLFRPTIGLDVTLDISGGKVPFFGANWTDSWDVNLIVSLGTNVSLFDAGSTKAQAAQARIQALQAREGYKQLLDSLDFQIQKSIEAVTYAYYRIEEKQAKSRFAEEQYKNAQVSFANELITRQEEMGARMAAIQAELELVAARFDYENARITLEYLTGER